MSKLGKPFGAKVENIEMETGTTTIHPVTESMKKTASELVMPLFEPTQTFINFTPEEVNQEIKLAHGSKEKQRKSATKKTIEAAKSLVIGGSNDIGRGIHPVRSGTRCAT